MAPTDLYGSNVDLPLLYGTHMGSIWQLRGTTTVPLLKKDPNINANNNDNDKIKIIVCSLQNESIYEIYLDYFPDMEVDSWSYLYFNSCVPITFKIEVYINTHEATISNYWKGRLLF